MEMIDQISMAFLVALQRLTPAEHEVLLLRDVFDFDYAEPCWLRTTPVWQRWWFLR